MEVFYETPLRYFLLEVKEEDIEIKAELNLVDPFTSMDNIIQLQKGEISDELKSFLEKNAKGDTIYLTDNFLKKTLSKIIKNKKFVFDLNLVRKIKENIDKIIDSNKHTKEILCISHKLANNKLEVKEKLDVLITETLSLIDTLEKDTNLHVMRIKEWYSQHFPELQDIITNNYDYLKSVIGVQRRSDFLKMKEEDFLHEIEGMENKKNKRVKNDWDQKFAEIKRQAESSMGTDLAENDVSKIVNECRSVLHSYDHKENLVGYLEERVKILAPNLVNLLGPLVSCRMIHACGSLMNLSKKPISTLQILGAEKTFFEAIKNKQNTPKYGYIYNAPLITQTPVQFKGKIARTLAAKAALASKIDIFSKDETGNMGKSSAENILKRIEALKVVKKKSKVNK